jgi:hypothetical protein
MSVASLDPNLSPSFFSNFGKIEIAGPGADVFSSRVRPTTTSSRSCERIPVSPTFHRRFPSTSGRRMRR